MVTMEMSCHLSRTSTHQHAFQSILREVPTFGHEVTSVSTFFELRKFEITPGTFYTPFLSEQKKYFKVSKRKMGITALLSLIFLLLTITCVVMIVLLYHGKIAEVPILSLYLGAAGNTLLGVILACLINMVIN